MKRTGSKRKLQAMATREKIFNAAVVLLEEKGFDGFTIDDIQDRTGCSRGLFYNYFRSINDVLSEVIFVNEQQYQAIRDKYLVGTRGAEKILLFTQYVAELHAHREHKNSLRMHYINLLKGETKGQHVCNDHRLGFVVMLEALEECQADGKLIAGIDLKQAAADIMVILRGTIVEYLMNDNTPAYSISDRAARMTAAYLSGIHIAGVHVTIPPIGQIGNDSIFSLKYFSDSRNNQPQIFVEGPTPSDVSS